MQLISDIRDLIPNDDSPGNLIGVLASDNIQTYASALAIISKSAGFVPFLASCPDSRNIEMIKDSKIKTLLTFDHSNRLIDQLKKIGKIEIINTNQTANVKIIDSIVSISDNQFVYMMYTSGSTGKPKGVPIYHKNINSYIEHMLTPEIYNLNNNDRFLNMFELNFDASIITFFTAISIGGCCYVVPRKGIINHNIVSSLEDHKITVAAIVPSVLNYLSPYFSEISFPDMRYFITGGESISSDVLMNWWKECIPNATIDFVYGPTEATVYCMKYRLHKDNIEKEIHKNTFPIGKTFKGTQAFIINANNKILEQGETGELCLVGEQITDHFWNDKSKTIRSFINIEGIDGKAYRTGDICFINEYENFVFLGRVDNQVQIDGYRIELGEIEYHVKELSKHDNVIALAFKNSEKKTLIHVVIEGFKGSNNKLINDLKTRLPFYMIPNFIHSIDNMPLNNNQKIDRKLLREIIQQKY